MPDINAEETIFTFSDAERIEFVQSAPLVDHYFELLRAYAQQQGGEVLAVWEILEGPHFGKNVMMMPDAAAAHLKVPVSRVAQIFDQTTAVVEPQWRSSPQFAVFKAARAHATPDPAAGDTPVP